MGVEEGAYNIAIIHRCPPGGKGQGYSGRVLTLTSPGYRAVSANIAGLS